MVGVLESVFVGNGEPLELSEAPFDRVSEGEGEKDQENDGLPESEDTTKLTALNREAVIDAVPHTDRVRERVAEVVRVEEIERVRLTEVV